MFGRKQSEAKRESESQEVAKAAADVVAEPRSSKGSRAHPVPPAPAEPVDFAQVGKQVATVLTAAKEAAEKIRAEADADAQRIREASELQAREALETAKTTAKRAQVEAAGIRAEVEELSNQMREQAEEYASGTRQEADAKAAAIVAKAEKRNSELEQAFHERRHSLDEGVVRTEKRLRQLIAGLRELAGGLEELMAPAEQAPSNGQPRVELPVRPAGDTPAMSRGGGLP